MKNTVIKTTVFIWIAMEKDRKEEYTVPARLDFNNIRKTMGKRSIGFTSCL
jgi:hypothetical protein